MKNLPLILGVFLLGLAFAYGETYLKSEREAVNDSRPCIPKAGAGEIIAATSAASDSNNAALTENVRYVISCRSDAWVRWCTSSTCTAASGDFEIPAYTIFPFTTGYAGSAGSSQIRWMAARNVAVTGQCTILECQ